MHPILFHAGPFLLPTYGAIVAIGLLLSLALALRTARQQGLSPASIWNLSIICLFSGAIGAKLWMIVTHLGALKTAPLLLLNLSAVSGGTQALAGSLVAAIVLVTYARRNDMPLRATLDALTAPILLLLAIESLGCLFAGCAFGTPAPQGKWSLTFHSAYAFIWWGTPLYIPLRPVQVWSAVLLAVLAAIMFWIGTWGIRSGRVAAWGILAASTIEFPLQFWRGDVRGWSLLPWLTPVQVACLVFMFLAAVLLWDPPGWRSPVATMERA